MLTFMGHIAGSRYACTESAIYTVSALGVPTLLAGSVHADEDFYEDGQGTAARICTPYGITFDRDGNLLLCDTEAHTIRKVTRSGTVSTLAGKGGNSGFADGPGGDARFSHPTGIAVSADGLIFVSDPGNNCIRQLAPCKGGWHVSTFAGDGKEVGGFRDGVGAHARFHGPQGMAMDSGGCLIVADCNNHCIRKVTTDEGRVSTVAGSREGGDAAAGLVDGVASLARFQSPQDVVVDGCNLIFVADESDRIRMISGGVGVVRVSTLAGSGITGTKDGEGRFAQFNSPICLSLDARGRLLVIEAALPKVRIVSTDLPWCFGRILFIGVLKTKTKAPGATGCFLNILPVEGTRSLACPLLIRIMKMVSIIQPRSAV